MENASKALIMAGSVLMAIIVISVLTIFFDNLRQVAQTKENAEGEFSIAEFNAQYDVYSRNVYGTELFSLANKIISYNEIEATNKNGYEEEPIHLHIVLKSDINSTFKKGTYNEYQWKNALDDLNNKITELGKLKFQATIPGTSTTQTRKLSVITTMRTNDRDEQGFTDDLKPLVRPGDKIPSNYKTMTLGELRTLYNSYKTDLSNIKENGYRYLGFDYYDKTSGRIKQLNYER